MKNLSSLTLLFFFLFQVATASEVILPGSENSIQDNIRENINKLEQLKTIKLNGEKIIGNQVITSLYKDTDYTPLWTSKKNQTDLVDILEDSYFDGLNPADYHIEDIKSYVNEIANGTSISTNDAAVADIVMTNALLTYAFHMIQGKVNPALLDPNWNYSKKVMADSVEFKIMHVLQTQTIKQQVENIRPELKMYHKFRALFERYDSIQNVNGDVEQIKYPGKSLRLGDTSEAVGELKRRINHFYISSNSSDDNVFDEELKAALIDFQKQNKLDADGIAGKKTFEMLNMSVKDRMDILRVNMERCRWLNNDVPDEFLLVNIAEYKLYIFRNQKIEYNCRVVVGKEYHKTPVFTSEIKYIAFNPTWTVPYSIASKETLPKLKADPQYLQKNNMTLLRGNNEVDPTTINFNNYTRRNFPFTIRQEPGPNNALGRVKFMFPNKHAVYLHDTPSKSFFEKTERAFSHGCVRVQNPLILAEQLLKNHGYDKKKIDDIVESEKLQNVSLEKFMTVMLMYWTCFEDIQDSEMYFHRDIYGRDKAVLKELNSRR